MVLCYLYVYILVRLGTEYKNCYAVVEDACYHFKEDVQIER